MYRQTAVVTDLAAARGFIDIKRSALLFDRVVVLKTRESNFDGRAKEQALPGVEPAELDWLEENGILSFENDYSQHLFEAEENEMQKYKEYRKACLGHVALIRKDSPKYEDYVRAAANFATRYSAARMQEKIDEDQRAVPLLYDPRYILNRLGATIPYPYATEAEASYARTTAAVLSQFPVPDELTPWEEILDFRKENESQLAFGGLREWIKDATSKNYTAVDLKDKLEHELARLEAALKRAKLKHRFQTIEAIVTSGADVIENLLELKLKEATKAAIGITRSLIETLPEEDVLAEHGLYFVVKAKEAFGERSDRT
jgi:hypothetical protein